MIRRKRVLLIGLPLLFVLFTANHLEYAVRTHRQHQAPPAIVVRAETSLLGHTNIGVDETHTMVTHGPRMLYFSSLATWAYNPAQPVPCPAPVRQMHGKPVTCVGFMYPLETGKQVRTFCLLRSTQTCCYGPRPQFNQYLLVESATPVPFERLAPVMVEGTFFVDPQPDDGYIYRMTARSVRRAGDDPPQIDAPAAAKQARLPLFPFDALALVKDTHGNEELPEALRAFNGKSVVIAGYGVGRTDDDPPRLLIGQAWWDGVSQGTPPTIYSAVMATPRDARQVPPLWQTRVVMTGILRLTPSRADWPAEGVVHIDDAMLGVPGQGTTIALDRGPMLPIGDELLALAALLGLTLGWRRRHSATADGEMTDG